MENGTGIITIYYRKVVGGYILCSMSQVVKDGIVQTRILSSSTANRTPIGRLSKLLAESIDATPNTKNYISIT